MVSFSFLCACLAAYLLGSVPFGLILTRMAGLGDIRKVGSGNIGATNVLRTGKKGLAALTLLLDGAKGAAVVLIADVYGMDDVSTFVLGTCAVIGHIFPVWLGFRGGKGVATFLGMILGFAPMIGLAALGTWLAAAVISKRSSVSALTATLVVPFILPGGWMVGLLCALLTALIWFKHKDNIRRIIAGTEPKIGDKK